MKFFFLSAIGNNYNKNLCIPTMFSKYYQHNIKRQFVKISFNYFVLQNKSKSRDVKLLLNITLYPPILNQNVTT